MKKIIIFTAIFLSVNAFLNAQKYFTKSGKISFFSEAPLENIEAHNSKVTSIIDLETGQIEFAVLIKAFLFEKALMQQHFNENYMESSTYPKASFKGNIENYHKIDLSRDQKHEVLVSGELSIHGVTHSIKTNGILEVSGGELSAQAGFEVKVADYDIKIPAVVRDNIAKVVEISVQCDYQPFTQK